MSDLSKEDWDVWAAIQLMARTPSFIELEERNEGSFFPEPLENRKLVRIFTL